MSHTLLKEGIISLGLEADPEKIGKIELLYRSLQRWNQVFNLTKIENETDFATKHVLDSLSVHPYLAGNRILDVGTGAGFPGIPLAIFFPKLNFVLLDSVGKKIRFVQQMLLELDLPNVEAAHIRVEHYAARAGFDTIVTRAFAEAGTGFSQCHHLLAPGGKFLAMKGRYPDAELDIMDRLPHRIIALSVPGLEAKRHLIEITKL